MSPMAYLATALALVWAGAAVYLMRLSSLRRGLEERLARLERGPEGRERDEG